MLGSKGEMLASKPPLLLSEGRMLLNGAHSPHSFSMATHWGTLLCLLKTTTAACSTPCRVPSFQHPAKEVGVMMHARKPNTWEVEAEGCL